MIEQAKVTYSPLGKTLEKQRKTTEDRGRKQIDVITNQNKRNDHQDNYKEIFEELVKERYDETKELTKEINHDDLIYYVKGITARKRFNDFNNGIELFGKIQSGEMKLEEVKKLKNENVFKSNLKEISIKTYK